MTQTKWCVDLFLDQIRKRDLNRELSRGEHAFGTEADARQFIIDRAQQGVIVAGQALMRAQQRLRKCTKKFGPKKDSACP